MKIYEHGRFTARLATTTVLVALSLLLPLAIKGAAQPSASSSQPCRFDEAAYGFAGTPVEQARCLLRKVERYGRLGASAERLPEPLEALVGQRLTLDEMTLRQYLLEHRINQDELGGDLSQPLAQFQTSQGEMRRTGYFVIHDVSTPNYLDEPFPSDINTRNWTWNDLARRWRSVQVAHVFINRLGESVTAVDFKSALPQRRFGTKFARDRLGEQGKALMAHVELVQPRRRDPQGSAQNDAIAPVPGFTTAQMDRLALVYVAASIRRGSWLVPAFHAAVDAGIPDAHDDPQNFDLRQWAARLGLLVGELEGRQRARALQTTNPVGVEASAARAQVWTTKALERERETGVAILRDVRAARQRGFTRVVFEFAGGEASGYRIAYVNRPVRQCGSGRVARVAGRRVLLVRLTPAQAHTEEGRATVRQLERRVSLGALREMKSLCDFEAQVEWALGLTASKRFRVMELSNPARLVLDIED